VTGSDPTAGEEPECACVRRLCRPARPATLAAAAGALALTVLLSGCSVLQIRTEDKDSGPVRVGVQKTAGPEPTGEPTEAGFPRG
jgi:hypothetical protein